MSDHTAARIITLDLFGVQRFLWRATCPNWQQSAYGESKRILTAFAGDETTFRILGSIGSRRNRQNHRRYLRPLVPNESMAWAAGLLDREKHPPFWLPLPNWWCQCFDTAYIRATYIRVACISLPAWLWTISGAVATFVSSDELRQTGTVFRSWGIVAVVISQR